MKRSKTKVDDGTQKQQGDVCIERTEIPAGVTPRKKHERGVVLAEGEVTGHAHVVEPEQGAEAELLELGQRLFLRIQGGNATVVHEEHKPVTLGPGEYEIGIVKEYDYDREEAVDVRD